MLKEQILHLTEIKNCNKNNLELILEMNKINGISIMFN